MLQSRLVTSFLFVICLLITQAKGDFTLIADIEYHTVAGIDPNLLSLDVYIPDGADGSNPVMVMYHGGSWSSGDKAITGVVHPKMEYYTQRGWIFLSVNYRLTNTQLPAGHPDQVTHPTHVQDVARSIAWIVENISTYGGNPDRIVLVGFSAGAHLVSLVTTDESRLGVHGYSAHDIDGVVLLDGLYDIPLRYLWTPLPPQEMLLVWGTDSAEQQDFSPALHVGPRECTPSTLVVHQDHPVTIEQSNNYANTLIANGYDADIYNAVGMTHSQIGGNLGNIGHPLTILVDDFLADLGSNAGTCCQADFTGDGLLNFFDVSAFLNAFNSANPSADFTNDDLFNFFDVSAFLADFAAGCP